MPVRWIGGRLVCSSTKCSFSSHPSAVKMKMKYMTPFLLTSPCIRSTCLVTRFLSFRNCSPASRSCDWALDLRTPRRSCPTHSSATSTGTTFTTSVFLRHSCPRLATPPTQATSTQNSPVLPLFLHRCNQVSFHQPPFGLFNHIADINILYSSFPSHAGRVPWFLLYSGLCLIPKSFATVPSLSVVFMSSCAQQIFVFLLQANISTSIFHYIAGRVASLHALDTLLDIPMKDLFLSTGVSTAACGFYGRR